MMQRGWRRAQGWAINRRVQAQHRRAPRCWEINDSLAEALAAKGDREGAIQAYEKVMAKNPKATSAIEMLRHLRGGPGKLTLSAGG